MKYNNQSVCEVYINLRSYHEKKANGIYCLIATDNISLPATVDFADAGSWIDLERKIRESDFIHPSKVKRYCYEYIKCFFVTELANSDDDMIDGIPSIIILLAKFNDEDIKRNVETLYTEWNSRGGNT